jgi:glycosyltransferase involved in cell wall biosynthesis
MPLGREDGPIVVIGNADSVFVQHPARYWRRQGHETVIVSGRWPEPLSALEDGTPVVAAYADVPRLLAREFQFLDPVLRALETEVERLDPERRDRVARAWGADKPLALVSSAVQTGLAVAAAVRALCPRVVFGHEAFACGLATALSYGAPRTLMVWGGDVELFAETSALHFALCRFALHSVEAVAVCAAPIADRVTGRFGVPSGRVHQISYGVNRQTFAPCDDRARRRLRERLGLPLDGPIVLNTRRFDPLWGSDVVLDACLLHAERHDGTHFVLIGGPGNDVRVSDAQRRVADRGASHRFSFRTGTLTLGEFADLLQVADIALSVPRDVEPRSWSVLQAMACGAPLVVGDQPTYRDMTTLGADAAFVDARSPEAVAAGLAELSDRPARRAEIRSHNLAYIERYEDEDRRMAELLRILEQGQVS